MEKKLTDEEVIEVLKNCGAGIHSSNCECRNCVLEHDGRCVNNLRKYSLDLIQRQKDIIQKQCELYDKFEIDYGKLVEKNAEQKAEIERLKGFIDFKTANVMCDKCKEQVVKDTAEEILQELFDEATSNVSETVELTTFQIEQLAKRYGVEVE